MPAVDRTRPYPLANALAVVGDYWSLLVLQEVSFGVQRFNRITANTGIRPNVPTVRLRKLVEHGVLPKELYEWPPDSARRWTSASLECRNRSVYGGRNRPVS